MPWTNYHSHCRYCDGTDQPERYVESAIREKMLAYGFSSHAPVPFHCGWCMKMSDLHAYFLDIKNLRHRWRKNIQVYCGLEVDYIPGKIGPNSDFIREMQLDYTIGSIHFVDAFPNGWPWEIDGSHSAFLQGLEQIFDGNIQQAVCRYFGLTRQMVREDCPDVIGHFDKIKIQNEGGALFSETEPWYREAVLQTLRTIADAGVIVEVNTRGLYKKKATETYPSRWVLEEMHRLAIPVTINSDAHHPEEITSHFSDAALVLKEAGYDQLSILLNGRWKSVSFDEKGLLVS